MALMPSLFSGAAAASILGQAARGVSEMLSSSGRQSGGSQEVYADPGFGWFDRMVNGLNRLPRPFLAFGTLGLFVYAMVEPESFGKRMVGLNLVPDPLWWLLGAVVGFYFGAREAYYFRRARPVGAPPQDVAAPPLDLQDKG
ncbi:holin family protein [Pseudorhodobacter aquimaris]|uniref:holin family protein n=1 Tax=Pseudorhodobacter aquimaris TaxID=687412 RepID=UPI00067C5B3C|nr:holin family protein [Pseudorhodobacter aquimaris]